MNRRWGRTTLVSLATATVLVAPLCLVAEPGTATARSTGPLPLPTLPLPLPSVSVSLPQVDLSPDPLPSLWPPTRTSPSAPSAPSPTGPPTPPARTSPTPVRPGAPVPPGADGSVVNPGSAASLITADPGADLYPQPPVDAADTPGARRVAALTDVQQRIQYLRNVLARTSADLARVSGTPDPVLGLLTALTSGAATDPDLASPLAPADSPEVVDTPTGRAVALSAAITSGRAELGRRQREEERLRAAIDHSVRREPGADVAAGPADGRQNRLRRPLAGRLTSRYGTRLDPYYHVWQVHPGVDLAAPVGTPIVTAADGRVSRAGWSGGYGNYTCIDHGRAAGQRLSTCYGHQSRLLVTPGQRVRAGEVIGLVGSTGASTGPHLHFEVRLGGRAVDPLPWLADDAADRSGAGAQPSPSA